jgi:hypothetical protein
MIAERIYSIKLANTSVIDNNDLLLFTITNIYIFKFFIIKTFKLN